MHDPVDVVVVVGVHPHVDVERGDGEAHREQLFNWKVPLKFLLDQNVSSENEWMLSEAANKFESLEGLRVRLRVRVNKGGFET